MHSLVVTHQVVVRAATKERRDFLMGWTQSPPPLVYGPLKALRSITSFTFDYGAHGSHQYG
jgi:hypothetical protein